MKRAAPFAWGAVLGLVTFLPALIAWSESGWGDWQWFHHQWEVGRVSILRFGEAPLWDPHHCGGVPLWGQPQAQVFSPTWWITGLPFGTTVGHKLYIVLHHAIGFAGMFVACRRVHRLAPAPSALAAIAWAFSGYFAWRASGGHSTFLAFHYLPWIWLCWRRAHDDVRYTAGVGVLMGLVLFEGGTYPFPLTFLVLCFDTIAYSIERPKHMLRVLRTASISGALTLSIGAARLWPIYLTMRRFPRATEVDDTISFAHVLESLGARDPHPWHWGGHRWAWAEYSAFVGWGVLALAVIGVVLAVTKRRHWHLPLGAAVFGAFAMGGVDEHWPWPLLHELPVFDNLHLPSRFHVLLTFYVTPLAAIAVHALLRAMKRTAIAPGTMRALTMLGWVLVCAVAMEVMTNSVRVAARWDGPILERAQASAFHLKSPAQYLERYSQYPSEHVGTIACYDPVPWTISRRLWTGEAPQVRIQPPSAGRLEAFERANHTLRAQLVLEEPARAIVNQNYDADWKVSAGTPVDDEGRLAIDLPAGEHTIEARYAPSDLPWSLLATLLGLVLAALLARFGPRARLPARD